jgi:hypothetical protein
VSRNDDDEEVAVSHNDELRLLGQTGDDEEDLMEGREELLGCCVSIGCLIAEILSDKSDSAVLDTTRRVGRAVVPARHDTTKEVACRVWAEESTRHAGTARHE